MTEATTRSFGATDLNGFDLHSIPRLSMGSKQMKHNWGVNMARKKMKEADRQKFNNVGLIKEDHDLLRMLAESEQRSMARQLSVIIREAVAVRAQA
mgnify:FL=1